MALLQPGTPRELQEAANSDNEVVEDAGLLPAVRSRAMSVGRWFKSKWSIDMRSSQIPLYLQPCDCSQIEGDGLSIPVEYLGTVDIPKQKPVAMLDAAITSLQETPSSHPHCTATGTESVLLSISKKNFKLIDINTQVVFASHNIRHIIRACLSPTHASIVCFIQVGCNGDSQVNTVHVLKTKLSRIAIQAMKYVFKNAGESMKKRNVHIDSVAASSSSDDSGEKLQSKRINRRLSFCDRILSLKSVDLLRLFDTEGRVQNELEFRRCVFRGGVASELRRELWKFIFGIYPFDKTAVECSAMRSELESKYRDLKYWWMCISNDPRKQDNAPRQDEKDTKGRSSEKTAGSSSGPFFQSLGCNCHNNEESHCNEIVDSILQAPFAETNVESLPTMLSFRDVTKIGSPSLRLYTSSREDTFPVLNVVEVLSVIEEIEKDVPRTDPDEDFFKESDNPNRLKLRDLLISYTLTHPAVGYTQGMNDIAAVFLRIEENESDAFWCFSNYLSNPCLAIGFSEKGMVAKLHLFAQLLESLDPALHNHFKERGFDAMVFCHRWLLLRFKREFSFENSVRIFEILGSEYLLKLALSKEHGLELSTDARSIMLTAQSFELFIGLAIFQINRRNLLECKEVSEVHEVIDNLAGNIDIDAVVMNAEALYDLWMRQLIEPTAFDDDIDSMKRQTMLSITLQQMGITRDVFESV